MCYYLTVLVGALQTERTIYLILLRKKTFTF